MANAEIKAGAELVVALAERSGSDCTEEIRTWLVSLVEDEGQIEELLAERLASAFPL